MNKIKILDCTIRDGGYYNQWKFSKNFIDAYIELVSILKIHFSEIGYINLENSKRIFRDFENNIINRFKSKDIKISGIINYNDIKLKQFIIPDERILQINNNLSILRIVININNLNHYFKLAPSLKKIKKCKLTLNIQGLQNLYSIKKYEDFLKKNHSSLKNYIIYLADSYGNISKDRLLEFKKINDKFNIKSGLHAHDNLGNALSNSIEAINEGYHIIDSTINGFGRGAGNLKTEEIMLKLNRDIQNLSSLVMLQRFILKYLECLKNKYNWGYNLFYSYATKNNIHPSYVQLLLTDSKISDSQAAEVLKSIKSYNLQKFDTNFKHFFKNIEKDLNKKRLNKITDLNIKKNSKVLIIGGGIKFKLTEKIIKFIKKNRLVVISINDSCIDENYVDYIFSAHPFKIPNLKELSVNIPICSPFSEITNCKKDSVLLRLKQSNTIKASLNHIEINHFNSLSFCLSVISYFSPQKIFFYGFSGNKMDFEQFNEDRKTLDIFKNKYDSVELYSLNKNKFNINFYEI